VASFKKPIPLRLGDTVAVIAPAGRPDLQGLRQSIEDLRSLGLAVVQYKDGRRDAAIAAFSASDEFRAQELAWALSEPGIKAVFCARAGYGNQRTLFHLQRNVRMMKLLKHASPRFVLGYSDCTFLHQWIQNQLKWISFHSPLVGFLKKPDLRVFVQALMSLPDRQADLNLGTARVLKRRGSASGRLVGGTLSLLRTAGPSQLPQEPMILCLEDVNEDHYALDRLIWNLIDAGWSPFVKGVILGTFEKCGLRDRKKFPWSAVLESLEQLCAGPIVQVKSFGHGLKRQAILPLGCRVSLNSSGRVRVLESQVSSRRG
jgi:muramoyltetrapeptide carboxypeptidase